jgi:hypothetical protein
MVGHPGASPDVSRIQAERIDVFLVPDKKLLPCAAPRFRRDLHPLMARSTTVRLDCFGFGTLARQNGWELVVMLHSSTSGTFRDDGFTVR